MRTSFTGETFARITRKTAELVRTVASQVVVSVVATACVAGLSSAYLKAGPPAPSAAALASAAPLTSGATGPAGFLAGVDAPSGALLIGSAFTPNGFRVRPTFPGEFASVFGPSPTQPFVTLASAEWPAVPAPQAAPASQVAPTSQVPQAASAPATPKARRTLAQACVGDCAPAATGAAPHVRPPARPAALSPAAADTSPQPESAREDEGTRLLGMPLPGFVATGEKMVRTAVGTAVGTAVSWGGSLTGLGHGS